jgi:hypothetical protein
MKNFKKSISSLILMIAINVCFAQSFPTLTTTSNSIPVDIELGDTIFVNIEDSIWINCNNLFICYSGVILMRLVSKNVITNVLEDIDTTYTYTNNTIFNFKIKSDSLYKYFISPDYSQTIYNFYIKSIDTTANSTTGIKNSNPGKSKIVVYPNPINDNLTILFSAFEHIQKVDILDIQGRMVLSNTNIDIGQNTLKLDVSTLNTGIYFVKINNRSYKFIKS